MPATSVSKRIVLSAAALLAPNGVAQDGLDKLLERVASHSKALNAAEQIHAAKRFQEEGTGYLPDPTVKFNAFAAPLETRNGPQRANVMVSQQLPWPSALKADEEAAAHSRAHSGQEKALLALKLRLRAQKLYFRYAELAEKIENKKKTKAALESLQQVALSRLELGGGQAEAASAAIEVIKLKQELKKIAASQAQIRNALTALVGGQDIGGLLPTQLASTWAEKGLIIPEKVDLSKHPAVLAARSQVKQAQAVVAQARARQLPKIAASASWFQVEEPDLQMPGTDPGRDAWAIGGSISLPLWGTKYTAQEKSSLAREAAQRMKAEQFELDLRAALKSTHEAWLAARDIAELYRKDLLPQARQVLNTDREGFSQGNRTFDKVLASHIRLIQAEDQLAETVAKQAILKAELDYHLSGQP